MVAETGQCSYCALPPGGLQRNPGNSRDLVDRQDKEQTARELGGGLLYAELLHWVRKSALTASCKNI